MSRLSEAVSVIPRLAWATAIALGLGVPILVFGFFYLSATSGGISHGEMAIVMAVPAIIGVFIFVYVLLIGYIAADARRRGMRPVLWVLLAIFIPNAIGIILYFILREPLLQACPKCGKGTNPAFSFCSSCGAALAETCPGCRNAVQPDWSHCVRCGTALRGA